MNKSNNDETISRNGYYCADDVIDQHGVMELPVFGDKKQNALSQQRKKEVLKSVRGPKKLAAKRQQCPPKNTADANRTGPITNVNNILFNDYVMRIKLLENKLTEANAKNSELTAENRFLKVQEKRYEHALSVHEDKHAKLPQMIKSYDEEIRTLKNRIVRVKTSFTEMENRYKSQTNELLVLQNTHAHLLSSPKKEVDSKKNKLHDRLEDAYNIIKQQQSEILRKIELQNKTHRYHTEPESSLQKQTLLEIKRCSDKINNLGLITPKHLNARQGLANGTTESPINITRRVAKPTIVGQDDVLNKTDGPPVSLKPELPRKKREVKHRPYKNREKWCN